MKKKVAALSLKGQQSMPQRPKTNCMPELQHHNNYLNVRKAIRDSQIINHGSTKGYCQRGCCTWLFTLSFYFAGYLFLYNS